MGHWGSVAITRHGYEARGHEAEAFTNHEAESLNFSEHEAEAEVEALTFLKHEAEAKTEAQMLSDYLEAFMKPFFHVH